MNELFQSNTYHYQIIISQHHIYHILNSVHHESIYEFVWTHILMTIFMTIGARNHIYVFKIINNKKNKGKIEKWPFSIQNPHFKTLSLHSLKIRPTPTLTNPTMAQTLTRAMTSLPTRHSTLALLFTKRFLSSPSTTSIVTSPPPLSSLLFSRRAIAPLSRAVALRFASVRCKATRAGPAGGGSSSSYSPLNSGSNYSDRPPTEMAPLFPGCDYEHWLIVMDKPGGENATKEQMIECYVNTLAQVVGR